jgi:Tfp pilus assembly protein PilF
VTRQSKRKLRGSTPSAARSGSSATGREAKSFSIEVRRQNRWQSYTVCFLLALAVWAVFGQTLHYEFLNYDDDQWVYKNFATIQGLSLNGLFGAFTQINCDEWYPLTVISHMLDCQIYGLNPGGHHLTNILLHAATAILLFLVLQKMTGALWRSAFVAVVFAIHPLRVESVAWITERKDVLSGLFFMLTLWAYTRYAQKRPQADGREPSDRRWMLDYCLALTFFIFGLLSKSMLVTLPFVLLLLDYWPLRRFAIDDLRFGDLTLHTSLLWEKIPFLLLAGFSCVPTMLAAKGQILAASDATLPWRIGNALVSYAIYIGQIFYPIRLAVFYPNLANNLEVWKIIVSALVLLIISAGILAGRTKYPYLLVGWLWYLGMLIPVIGLIQEGPLARADRYTYLPQIGLYLMLAWGMAEFCGRWHHRRAVLGTTVGAILAALLAVAYVQTNYWKDNITLWKHDLACTPDNSITQCYLGVALAEEGKITEAIQYYKRALLLDPNNIDAHNNLGNALVRQGKLTEAVQHYEQALQRKPDSADTHYNLAIALASQGKLNEASQHFERALQLKPHDPEGLNRLGITLAMQGKLDEAIQCYRQALQLKPDYFEAFNSLGITFAKQGKMDEASQQFERALQLKPDDPESLNNLGYVLATQGKLDEAIPRFQQALTLATARGDAALAEAIRARIKYYQPASVQQQTP